MERNAITLDGQEVTFGPFRAGERPEVLNMDWQAEIAVAVLSGGSLRTVKWVNAIRSGIEAGIVRPEHLGAIERAVGPREDGFDLLEWAGIPYGWTGGTLIAVAWVVRHDPARWSPGMEIPPVDSEEFVAEWSQHLREAGVSLEVAPV